MRKVVDAIKTPVTLVLLLAILGMGAYWGWNAVKAPPPERPRDPCVTQSVPGFLSSKMVTVRVYNGGTVSGLAGKTTANLRNKGFKALTPQNSKERILKTEIRGADAKSPEVVLVASFFKNSVIKADGRPDHTVDVYVGNQFGGFIETAKTTIPVASGQVCLPSESPTATPTPTATQKPATPAKPTASKTNE